MELLYLIKLQERVTWVPTESIQRSDPRGEDLGETCVSTEDAILLVDRHARVHDQRVTMPADFWPVVLPNHSKSAVLVSNVRMGKSLHRQTDVCGIRDLP